MDSEYRAAFRRFRSPSALVISLSILLLAVFQAERVVTELVGRDSVSGMLNSTSGSWRLLLIAVSPILHSSALHVVENLTFLIPVSLLYARRTGVSQFWMYIYGVGIFTTAIGPTIAQSLGISTALAVGISGVVYALVFQEYLYLAYAYLKRVARGELSGPLFSVFLVMTLIFFVHVRNLLQGPTVPGQSFVGHLCGALVGIPLGIYAVYSIRSDEEPWLQ